MKKLTSIILVMIFNEANCFKPPSRSSFCSISISQPQNGVQSKISARPPAFSVVDDDPDSAVGAPYMPPNFTIEDDGGSGNVDTQESVSSSGTKTSDITVAYGDDPYQEETRPASLRRPKRPKRKTPVPSKMEKTSWMEKNAKFSVGQDGMAMNESMPGSSRLGRKDESARLRSNMDAKSFRQDFRGTRVFVQGIAPGTSWQDLKDHFQIAGNVVFASVSVNPVTGETKGHGIVQYETTSMAQNAIEIMRDHPLNGASLYVREDVQENSNPNAQLVPKGPTPPTKWKCANEDNIACMSSEELETIQSLIKARDGARRRRKYDVSDRIRDDLKDTHGVFIDDRLKMWWTTIDGNKIPQTIQDIKGEGRWKLKPWRQIPTTPENDACVNPDMVEGLLKQRDIARREKDFRTADELLEDARMSPDGDLTLRIHDESRTWRVWTDAPPPKPFDSLSPDDPTQQRKRAARECMAIVEEFAPDKIDEIKLVLKKFEGREFQVLKRLKNQYF